MAMDLARKGAMQLEPWITHHFALDAAEEAFDVMLNKIERRAFKVMITM